jgi:hypothetical protein
MAVVIAFIEKSHLAFLLECNYELQNERESQGNQG